MASEDVWILGIKMTKFGKHKDKDVLDLATEAVRGALEDGGVSMRDMGVIAAGNLMGRGSIAQEIQKQVGQTGIPAYNVANACATGATALRVAYLSVKAGEADFGLAVSRGVNSQLLNLQLPKASSISRVLLEFHRLPWELEVE